MYAKSSESQFNFLQAYSSVREQTEMFRLGVQKCKKIIYDCIPPDPELFKCEGIEVLFNILRRDFEGKEMPEHERINQDRYLSYFNLICTQFYRNENDLKCIPIVVC